MFDCCSNIMEARLTASGQQPHSSDDHQEGPPSPWGWAGTGARSFPQTPSNQFLLVHRRLLLATDNIHNIMSERTDSTIDLEVFLLNCYLCQ